MKERIKGIYFVTDEALVCKVCYNPQYELDNLFGCETSDDVLHYRAKACLVDRNKRVEVNVGKESHDKLAIHTIRHAAMTGDGMTKVLDLKSSLETRSEETTKRGDERRKCCQDHCVN